MSSAAIGSGKAGRARITNGTELLPGVDGRSVWARVMRDTLAAVLTHCGGAGAASELKRMAARRIAALEAELIHLEGKFARIHADGGEPDANDLDLYGRLANGQRRHMEALGWEPTPRDVTLSLQTYLRRRPASPAVDDDSSDIEGGGED